MLVTRNVENFQRRLERVAAMQVYSGPYETPEMIKAGQAYVKAVTTFLKVIGAAKVVVSRNHFERTVRFTLCGKQYALYSGDFRLWTGGSRSLGPYFREIANYEDHRGGSNRQPAFENIAMSLAGLVDDSF